MTVWLCDGYTYVTIAEFQCGSVTAGLWSTQIFRTDYSASCENPADSALTQLDTLFFLIDIKSMAQFLDSSSIQLTQLWLKWRPAWFDSDLTHILDFHGRLNSDSTHLSQSRVKFDSPLMSRAQPYVTAWQSGSRGGGGADLSPCVQDKAGLSRSERMQRVFLPPPPPLRRM